MQCVIHTAHSRHKWGYQAHSVEHWGSNRAGWHTASGDTLTEAQDALHRLIASDWRRVGKPIPECIDKGRVSHICGINGSF